MQSLPREQLLASDRGRHFASEPHIRIQILRLSAAAPHRTTGSELFANYHGELLVIALDGAISIQTKDRELQLRPGDQALLIDGEPFRLVRGAGAADPIVELIWTPGPNPCKSCWENADRYFGETAGPPEGAEGQEG